MNKTVLTVVLVVAGVASLVAAQFVAKENMSLVQQAGMFLIGLALDPTKLLGAKS